MIKFRRIALGVAAIAVVMVALAVAFASTPDHDAKPAAATATGGSSQPAAATTPAADPYAVYLATAPVGAVHLSREDAQTRARLGCGQTFAPGTIDAALAAAYRPTGICG